jgi:SecD/SecF fusion protein
MQRSIDLMQQRVNAFGVSEAELFQSGQDQIEVNLPGVTDAESAAEQVGSTAQLFFYDWEANILDDKCKADGDVNANQRSPINTLYAAVTQASKCKDIGVGTGSDPLAKDSPGGESQAAADPRFYVFDKQNRKPLADGQTFDSRQEALDALTPAERANAEVIEVPAGVLVLREQRADADAPKPDRWWVIQDRPGLSGTDIKSPEQSFDQTVGNQPIVTFDFTDQGRKAFHAITRRIAERGVDNAFGQDPQLASQHFAIALDDELVSSPTIDFRQYPDGIDSSTGAQISGSFTIQSAQDLAKILKIGALPLELNEVSRSQVSATLGKQALDQGLKAGIAGFIIVALFLIIYYRILGVIATVALCIYALYFYAVVKLIPITLTLPGIAGLVLTLGVAADANIVVFERIKEEVGHGRSVRAAIGIGYRRGLSTIIDANVVTFMTAFILFMLSQAGVKGFALMLGLGTLVTLFSAILATQALLGATGGAGLRNASSVGARTHGRKRQLNFAGATKWLFSLSGVILAAGSLAIATKGFELGIDFKSGTRIQASFQKQADEDQVRSVLAKQGLEAAEVQKVTGSDLGPNTFQVSTGQLRPAQVNGVTGALDRAFGIRGSPDSDSIGPTFGESIARSALIAVIASLLVIAVYVALRFEIKYAGTTAISLAHDLMITAGLYAITGREVNSSTVAALLTVLGFSLYDTIIVSDRIRENTPRMPTATFSQINNRSMNEVIVRSLATVTCASLPILALFLFGGDTLQDFAFALLVGTISGAYSSIFISSPVLTEWKEREPAYRRRRRAQKERYGEVPPFAPEGSVVERKEEKKAPPKRLTAPDDPERRVSKQEFEALVADLDVDDAKPAAPIVEDDPARDLSPEELVLKDDKKQRPKRGGPRNKRHGRPR